MTQIISVHSFRGGTGKSNTTANLAALIMRQGKRVGIIDTDIQSPGIHILFGMSGESIPYSLNDYLWGRCTIEQAAHDVTARIGVTDGAGMAYLIPSSMRPGEIARVLRDGYNVGLLSDGIRQVIAALDLDVLLIDTHPGLNEETLLSIAISNTLLVVMRPDEQDYEGTGVAIKVARRLEVQQMLLIVNKTPKAFDPQQVKDQVENTYDCEVAAVLRHSDDLMMLGSRDIFVNRFPEHDLTVQYKKILARIMP
ncbi:MAG: MinD/ParA family protein [Anaerolineae bacterium]|nr:MinD/ParA family protein [Anaerolineae bacterium]